MSKKSSHELHSSEPSHELTKEDVSDQMSLKKMNDYSVINNNQRQSINTSSNLPISTTSSYEFIGHLINSNGQAIFIDGSKYQGTWDFLGMAGAGIYRMPHDVLYEGQIRDGMQHGEGTLEYPGKQLINGVWNRGEVKKFKYIFNDGLIYETENWNYCKFPDRRFYRSIINGLNPAGRSLKTQDQPTKIIPLGCYDSGDGIFDPSTLCVTNFDQPSKIIRIPSANECEWITKHCRKGGTEPTGYRPWLNENWASDPPNLPYRLPMSNDSPETWWKRISTFDRDLSVISKEMRRSLWTDKDQIQSESQKEYWSQEEHTKCICVPEEPQLDTELMYSVCGDQSSEESSLTYSDYLREVVCDVMTNYSGQEYEGEYKEEDLLMTVCCPPEPTILRRRRESSVKSLDRNKKDRDMEEEEDDDVESISEDFFAEESFTSIIDWREEIERESEYENLLSSDTTLREISMKEFRDDFESSDKLVEKSMTEKDDFRLLVESEKQVMKKRKSGKAKKTRAVKKVGLKKQTKQPCPVVEDKEQLLQRKVGDLLFSPALDAPRSPVQLVRKDCDKKSCAKPKLPKYDYVKCGVTLSPGNLPATKRIARVCNENDKKVKEKLNYENKNICSFSSPFS